LNNIFDYFYISLKTIGMKNLSILLGIFFIGAILILNSCKKEDLLAPVVYLLGSESQILDDSQSDTTVLLFTKYIDPGIMSEDNVTAVEDIVVTNDGDNVLEYTDDGYLERAEHVQLTYTATDEAGNYASIIRDIYIKNISEPFATTYITDGTTMFIPDETNYNSIVTADSRIPGRINFPKVYKHEESSTEIYFKVAAELYSPTYSQNYSTEIGYMGTPSDKEIPFFVDMTYDEGVDAILEFDYLMINAQNFTDALGNEYTIAGVADPLNVDLPYSRIEYLTGTKTVKRIILELNVTKEGQYVDRVTEIYTPL
jgi:hypothetical protein